MKVLMVILTLLAFSSIAQAERSSGSHLCSSANDIERDANTNPTSKTDETNQPKQRR